jgi:uncharacterized HhH-GPD family protein
MDAHAAIYGDPMPELCLAQRPEADALLSRDPLALLIGMVLDQQMPLEWAFTGPLTLTERLGHELDVKELADYEPEKLAKVFAKPPAIHRFPSAMAARVQALCQLIVSEYDGEPAGIWTGVKDGEALPGFGKHKAAIFVALLGKQYGVTPRGWRDAAGAFGKRGSLLSVADITDGATLLKVREAKKLAKAAAKTAKA